jgi:DNA-nicking Smr family endonuclease
MPFISDDEKNIFRDAMRHVKPLSRAAHAQAPAILPAKQALLKNKTKSFEKIPPPRTHLPITTQPQRTVSGADTLSFQHTGLQHKKFTQLKQGKLRIDATLDLHEHTRDEALIATDDFLTRCQNKRLRVVCLIHGKGLYSSHDEPVLKNMLNQYLRSHPAVLAFHSARHNQGGTGALIVLLKAI